MEVGQLVAPAPAATAQVSASSLLSALLREESGRCYRMLLLSPTTTATSCLGFVVPRLNSENAPPPELLPYVLQTAADYASVARRWSQALTECNSILRRFFRLGSWVSSRMVLEIETALRRILHLESVAPPVRLFCLREPRFSVVFALPLELSVSRIVSLPLVLETSQNNYEHQGAETTTRKNDKTIRPEKIKLRVSERSLITRTPILGTSGKTASFLEPIVQPSTIGVQDQLYGAVTEGSAGALASSSGCISGLRFDDRAELLFRVVGLVNAAGGGDSPLKRSTGAGTSKALLYSARGTKHFAACFLPYFTKPANDPRERVYVHADASENFALDPMNKHRDTSAGAGSHDHDEADLQHEDTPAYCAKTGRFYKVLRSGKAVRGVVHDRNWVVVDCDVYGKLYLPRTDHFTDAAFLAPEERACGTSGTDLIHAGTTRKNNGAASEQIVGDETAAAREASGRTGTPSPCAPHSPVLSAASPRSASPRRRRGSSSPASRAGGAATARGPVTNFLCVLDLQKEAHRMALEKAAEQERQRVSLCQRVLLVPWASCTRVEEDSPCLCYLAWHRVNEFFLQRGPLPSALVYAELKVSGRLMHLPCHDHELSTLRHTVTTSKRASIRIASR
ncbi:unnamed protein product [Amoebophrya sp. A120]|nr:unnamed protein product [Amoebophrya sp. A120]|eukprot:GSA120T00020324001.1